MPELKNNQASRTFPKIDFDEWAKLAESDPEAFEDRRRTIIENAISCSKPRQQQRLRCLQWKIDQVRNRCQTPLGACVKISNMMWDSLAGPGGLKESLEQLQRPTGLHKAEVLDLYPSGRSKPA